jgi:hypothetical protein
LTQSKGAWGFTRPLRSFLNDFASLGARPNRRELRAPDLWGLPVGLLGAISSFVTQLKTSLVDFLGLPAIIVPSVLTVIGILWSGRIITAKAIYHYNFIAPSAHLPTEYSYSEGLRLCAKCALPLLLFVSLYASAEALLELWPLPTTIYGYIIDPAVGAPFADVELTVEDSHGASVSAAPVRTDSGGFYIIHTDRRLQRTARLRARPPKCGRSSYLSLNRWHETQTDFGGNAFPPDVHPVFRYLLSCGE